MITGAYGQKLGMTHIYNDKNRHIPVTILKVAPQVVTALRTQQKDQYTAIQIGTIGSKHINKPQMSELKTHDIDLVIDHRTELRTDKDDQNQVKLGQTINVSLFAEGDTVMVTAISKGKGFSGTVKRHNFSRGPETHGSQNVRAPGSIGSGYPQRVVPGRKLPGHMGHERVTTQGLKIVAVNTKDSTLAISGAIPGPNKSLVLIRKTGQGAVG